MFDHIGINVTDYVKSKAFYTQALASLGVTMLYEVAPGVACGFGKDSPHFWVSAGDAEHPVTTAHIAFSAATRDDVQKFYDAAIAAGGKDNGAPGLRPEYHEHYYGAFVIDLDGNNVEAVCHSPEV